MKTQTGYEVIVKDDLPTLEKEVKRYLGLGWECLGGIAVYHQRETSYQVPATKFVQAMAKYEDKP